jgi:hypothetical protein
MVKLGTDLADPADRLKLIHRSMLTGKEALGSMTPVQILAMSAIGMAPSIVTPDAAAARDRAPAVQPDHQQRAGAQEAALHERRQDGRHLPAVDPDPGHGAEHHLQQLRPGHGLRSDRLPSQRSRTCSGC